MKNIFLVFITFISVQMFAQKPATQIVQGNKQYNTRHYSQAEALYRSAFSQDDKSAFASYDKGNAIYRQYQTNESIGSYQQALKVAKTKDEKHRIYHNLGNAFMKQKNYGAAVEAYKNALRNNPNDDETRYNYALAKKMQQENQDQNQDNKDNKDQEDQDNKDNKDNKDQDKKDDKGDNPKDDKKDQDKKDNKGDDPKDDKKDQGNKDPQQQKQDQTKQQMENMLNALNNQEQRVRERVQGKEREGKPVKTTSTKDW